MQGDLSSKWGSLSPTLLSRLYAVDARGVPEQGQPGVLSPVTDCQLESTANWQSPFEQMGPETKIPAVMAMLQSGTLQASALLLQGRAGPNDTGFLATLGRTLAQEVGEFAQAPRAAAA